MKRTLITIISMVLALTLFASLTACSSKEGENSADASSEQEKPASGNMLPSEDEDGNAYKVADFWGDSQGLATGSAKGVGISSEEKGGDVSNPDRIVYWEQLAVSVGPVDGNISDKQTLFEGRPVWSLYLCDLTGDGIPELCSTVGNGKGAKDVYIVVYDYITEALYTLKDSKVYDYFLTLDQGIIRGNLKVVKSEYGGEEISVGELALVPAGDSSGGEELVLTVVNVTER